MDIAIIGAGAIGSLVAAKLHQGGEKVLLVGRSDHIDAIKRDGLTISGATQKEVLKIPASTKLDRVYDLVIFGVKTQDLEQAYYDHNEFLPNHCAVLSIQNGVQADNLLGFHFEKFRIMTSIVMFGATYNKPGHIIYNFPGKWIIGKPFTVLDPMTTDVADLLLKSFDVVVTPEIMGMKWLKLFINFNNCIPALTGKSMQESFSHMDLCRLSVRLLKEGLNIIDKAGIKLVSLPDFPKDRIRGLAQMPEERAAGIVQKTMTSLSKEPLYGSILQSILRKRISEIDYINGEVAMMAKHVRGEAPLNEKVVDLVHEIERGRCFLNAQELKEEFKL